MKCLAISGGVGGAKLALGLSKVLSPEELTIVGNTGDDFEHLGLKICPDLDTVMYTLAELSNRDLGWGQAGESWQFLDALERLGGESWFRLGDRDMATHIQRSVLLASGKSLSAATSQLCASLGIRHPIVPMSDDVIATQVQLKSGETLAFQHYFVRDRCKPEVSGFDFAGIDAAKPSAGFVSALEDEALSAVIICPSNPFVSVDPVLNITGIEASLKASSAPVIAVSPIIGGEAIKGPAAKMMTELGMPQTALAVAEHYVGRIDGFVIDQADADLAEDIERLGMQCLVTKTLMLSLEDRIHLAEACIGFAAEIERTP
ncbi:MAG: LPPG:FO 2-phospho-L-lactate transferase [Candidatus Azotimanducaceae bacterium]|jgi:LPPG:FO 2-phospho-L-lactate transferase